MLMRHEDMKSGKPIGVDRSQGVSDRQRELTRRSRALLAAAGMDEPVDFKRYIDLKQNRTEEDRAIRMCNLAMASRPLMEESAKVRWICLEVKAGRESSVNKALSRANIETLIPWLPEETKVLRGRKVTVPPRALYDGYVLVHCGISPASMQGLSQVKNVVKIIGGAESPHVVSANIISNIMRLVASDEVMIIDAIAANDKVYVTKGLYVFLEGVVLSVRKRRAKIEISYEGRNHVIEMPLAYVRKL